jgi:hypothetical protein
MTVELKKRFCLPYRSIADQVGLSYTTLMRWKQRIADGQPAVKRPGPKKVKPLDIEQLKRKISALDNGSKRSRGTGRLQGAVADQISRRDLNRLISLARRRSNRQRAAETCRVSWLRPNLAWAMDDWQQNRHRRRQAASAQPLGSGLALQATADGFKLSALRRRVGRASGSAF